MSSERASHSKFNLHQSLERIGHWLPAQGPIKDFIHHNTLHAFQHLKFHDATFAAAKLYGANLSLSGQFYFKSLKEGVISNAALDRALEREFKDATERATAKHQIVSAPIEIPKFPGLHASGLRAQWTQELEGVSLDRYAHPLLFQLVGGYLDQGLSLWRMPGADKLGFFDSVAELVKNSWLPLMPLNRPIARKLLSGLSATAAIEALERIVGREDWFEDYLLEMLLAQPGWAGLANQCQQQLGTLLSPRFIQLLDYTAISLVLEASSLERKLGKDFRPLSKVLKSEPSSVQPDALPTLTSDIKCLRVLQEAFEWSYYEPLLGGIAAVASERPRIPKSSAWAFFCIDDRECSLRRHIEEVNPAIRTYATAGFFGLDFMYQGAEDSVAGKHCPLPIKPQFLVIEEHEHTNNPPKLDQFRWHPKTMSLEPRANTFFRGWVLSHALGFGAALRLAASVFKPGVAPVKVAPLSTVSQNARLRLARSKDLKTKEGLWIGFSIPELAERVQGLLQSVGLEGNWPDLVVFFGHGSSSVNNPYFAAYNCGACSGRPGAPNARAIAEASNMPEVRQALKAVGLSIPEQTWFLGALHDTTTDEVTYYDTSRLPPRLTDAFDEFKKTMETALARNAAERCRRFDTIADGIAPKEAIKEVQARAQSLFEPRPEYNHATNAACVIGRRSLTEGIFLDRRAFLSSYDPSNDPEGIILSQILTAVIPVCAGINLEYYFSRVDPWKYGAGTKLSQNVTGLIGVINGIEGDLLTGLPMQMTEIHDPVRLLTIVEQTPRVALEAVSRNQVNKELVENEWVRYGCVDPFSHEIWLFLEGRMTKIEGLKVPQLCWRDSLEAARTGHGNLPMGFIKRPEGEI